MANAGMSEFSFFIEHKAGATMGLPDALSRLIMVCKEQTGECKVKEGNMANSGHISSEDIDDDSIFLNHDDPKDIRRGPRRVENRVSKSVSHPGGRRPAHKKKIIRRLFFRRNSYS